MSTFWNDEDLAMAKRKGIQVLLSNTTPETLKEQEKELPTDTHLVAYIIPVEMDGMWGEKVVYDAVRAGKKVDIFDLYYDRLKAENGRLKSIDVGYGLVKPKLWQPPKAS